MKKILIVQGGGRANGNTAQLAKAFMKGAQEAGHEVELVSLNNVQVNGCIGCNACRYGKPLRAEGWFQQPCAQDSVRGPDCLCFPAVFLDHLVKAQSLYRAVLLHRPAG